MDNLFLIIFILSILGVIIFGLLSFVQFSKKDKSKGKKQIKLAGISLAVLVVSFICFGMTTDQIETETTEENNEQVKEQVEVPVKEPEETKVEKEAKEEVEQKANEQKEKAEGISREENAVADKNPPTADAVPLWQEEISKLAENSDGPSDKFRALEQFLINNDVTKSEVEEFTSYIINDYKSGNYLGDINNHERMLTNILKSYYVEQNSEGALKDFAFDYFQNMKYTYRGVDAVDSESVKANERQMDKALAEIE